MVEHEQGRVFDAKALTGLTARGRGDVRFDGCSDASIPCGGFSSWSQSSYAYVCVVLVSAAGSRDDGIFAEKLLEDTVARMRRVFGNEHPHTRNAEGDLTEIRRHIANL